VGLIKILESKKFDNCLIKDDTNNVSVNKDNQTKMTIPYAVGYDMIRGEMVIADVAKFPHLIVGGATGFGKSSALHCLIMSIVYKQSPDKVRIMLLDFGPSKLNFFNKTPHMLGATVEIGSEVKGLEYLSILKEEMKRREIILNRNNKTFDKLPSIVCVIDEFPTFIRAITKSTGNKNAHELITEILDRARKTKIHIVLAANNSSKINIGINLTSLPAAIAFKCTTWRDSMTILNEPDASQLTGIGSMYFKSYLHEGLVRLQGAYIEPDEIKKRLNNMEFDYSCRNRFRLEGLNDSRIPNENNDNLEFNDAHYDTANDIIDDQDNLRELVLADANERKLADIILWALKRKNFSNNQIKKEFRMGYDKADRFLTKLELLKLVTELREGTRLARNVIPKCFDDLSNEAVSLLIRCGYTRRDVEKVFNIQKEVK